MQDRLSMGDKIAGIGFVSLCLTILISVTSCAMQVNEMGELETQIRAINKSVQAQKWICDGIEEPVYYRGRKIYNGAFTRYYKYQSAKTGKMYRPKKKPVCQELGKRPFTPSALREIKRLEEKLRVEQDSLYRRNITALIIIFLIFTIVLSSERIKKKKKLE